METKHLVLSIPEPKKESPKERAPPKKKVVAESEEWSLISQHLDFESQKRVLQELNESRDPIHLHLERAIRTKLAGYKSQDIAKTLYDPTQFIQYDQVVACLTKSDLKCFYCRLPVHLFYEYVREPKQWSLERIDNSQGHNTDNVEIACLECNLRRKTMYHERFVFTKQAVIVKHGGGT
jgi:5-methylcytosine-specific restriction endonuclease McrA